MQRKRKSRKGGSYSTLSLLRKELREGNLQSLFGGSSCIVSSSNAADPLLSSFILPLANEHTSSQPHLHTEARSSKKGSDESVSTRYICFSSISFSENFYFLFMEFCSILQKYSWCGWLPTVSIYCTYIRSLETVLYHSNIVTFWIRIFH